MGSITESERSSGGGHGNPLQYSCLKYPMAEEPGGLQSWDHKESDTTEATEHTHKHGINNPTVSDFQMPIYSHWSVLGQGAHSSLSKLVQAWFQYAIGPGYRYVYSIPLWLFYLLSFLFFLPETMKWDILCSSFCQNYAEKANITD